MIETLTDVYNRHPAFFAVFMFTVGWPTLTGLLSFGQAAIAKRFPGVWKTLATNGLDLAGFLRFISGGNAQELRPVTDAVAIRAALPGEGRDDAEQLRLRIAYSDYVRAAGGKNREGLALPSWDDLPIEAREPFAAFGRRVQTDLDARRAVSL